MTTVDEIAARPREWAKGITRGQTMKAKYEDRQQEVAGGTRSKLPFMRCRVAIIVVVNSGGIARQEVSH